MNNPAKYEEIDEGLARTAIPKEKKISKALPVFYNPVMKFNRDISILLLNALDKKEMQMALPLAGTGVRGVRFLLELGRDKIKTIYFNDYSKEALKIIKRNLELNRIDAKKGSKVVLSEKDANLFLLEGKGFDYIDVDPFGTPNPYLDSAIRRIARKGVLAVTATDTSALCGTYLNAGKRKYWAVPLRNALMHEIGLRIIIRKIQLIGAQYDKALIPVFSYSKEHYMRVFFSCEKSKSETDKILRQHSYFLFCNKCLDFKTSEFNREECRCGNWFDHYGPIFAGQLWENKLLDRMIKLCEDIETKTFLGIVKDESKFKGAGFYDMPLISKIYKLGKIPKKEIILKKLKGAETIFAKNGIKTTKSLKDVLAVLRL